MLLLHMQIPVNNQKAAQGKKIWIDSGTASSLFELSDPDHFRRSIHNNWSAVRLTAVSFNLMSLQYCISHLMADSFSCLSLVCDRKSLRPKCRSIFGRNSFGIIGRFRTFSAEKNLFPPKSFNAALLSLSCYFRGLLTSPYLALNYGRNCHFRPKMAVSNVNSFFGRKLS